MELICRAAAKPKAKAKTLNWKDDQKTKDAKEQQGQKKRKMGEMKETEV